MKKPCWKPKKGSMSICADIRLHGPEAVFRAAEMGICQGKQFLVCIQRCCKDAAHFLQRCCTLLAVTLHTSCSDTATPFAVMLQLLCSAFAVVVCKIGYSSLSVPKKVCQKEKREHKLHELHKYVFYRIFIISMLSFCEFV